MKAPKGWKYINCFCAGGTNCDGYECGVCAGWGAYYKHIKSGVLAIYPGGPFLGSEPKGENNEQ